MDWQERRLPMSGVRVILTKEDYADGVRSAVDAVARERLYIGIVEGVSLERTRTYIRELLAGGGIQVLGVDENDVVVGWCDIVRNSQEGFRHCGRLWMGILPEYRGCGIGKRLAQSCIDRARDAGIERVELEVFSTNERAIALYRRLGFLTEGVKRFARKLDGKYEDKLIMALVAQPLE
jgi:ribosomal protein S18 acetylase RimI-like enzyme